MRRLVERIRVVSAIEIYLGKGIERVWYFLVQLFIKLHSHPATSTCSACSPPVKFMIVCTSELLASADRSGRFVRSSRFFCWKVKTLTFTRFWIKAFISMDCEIMSSRLNVESEESEFQAAVTCNDK